MERIVGTIEMSESRNIVNIENSDKVVTKATNRRGQKKTKTNVGRILPHLKPKLLGNTNLEWKMTTLQCFIE